MNFMSILKAIFPAQPTLDEFIKSHKPESILDVEYLERQYDRLMATDSFMTQNAVR